ncbi:diguanylate cyclase domain-containing protein [Vogesella sp. LIG4]|uniref:diguanylate cyclase domain-containing protein n=1 Tax=Vogesella sp. LIG4 TaxID=1192162 RepID=UPI000820005E|nr:diguanylate cyclase [Vogesella sp. LIG4]SCK26523.1 diguanylate cyclase (GGDEF) domain-containing protein [Vogesella sp. LIG4]
MRFGIAAKLALLLAAVGMVFASLVGVYSYSVSRNLLVESSQQTLLAATQILGRRLDSSLQEVARDVDVLASHPLVQRTLQHPDAQSNEQLARLFELIMKASPDYFQIRLISAGNFGLERVRVDRVGASLQRVPDEDLQEKGHFPYVSETLRLPAGSIYMSRITINHERGLYSGAERPSMQVAMPVVGDGGRALGVVVVNVDVDGLFAMLAADLPSDLHLFLANGQGDILIHPDRSKTFGFDRGRRVLIQEEYPSTAPLLSGRVAQVAFQQTDADTASPPMLLAFVRQALKLHSDDHLLYVGLEQPLSAGAIGSHQMGQLILVSVLVVGLLGMLAAVLLTRFMLRPLRQLTVAANRFGRGEQVAELPLGRRDEIGELAQSFHHMQLQIGEQVASLQASQEQLKLLAQYDSLTGLPNRRMLQDRLDLAITRAMRHGEHVALLFIDLDNFKDINDGWGHDAGDVVLVEIAQRLRQSVRAVDTVARLGGDEFVVLLDGPGQQHDIAAVARKMLDNLALGIAFQGITLRVGASVGISVFPQGGASASALLIGADRAMYRVKAGGGGSYGFAEGEP